MSLKPLDIMNKKFRKKFNGYSEEEVNEFRIQVSKDYESVLEANQDFKEQIILLQERVSHYEKQENTINQSIVVAIKAGEDAKQQAKEEAKLIIESAEKNAEEIIQEALLKEKNILLRIEELKKQENEFKDKLQKTVEAHLGLLTIEETNEEKKAHII